MKRSLDEKKLDELLESGRILEEKAKKFASLAEAFAQKWERRLEGRKAAK